MTSVASALLSGSEILDASLLLAKRHFLTILRATLPALLLTAVVELAIEVLMQSPDRALLGMPAVLMAWGLAEALAIGACWDLVHGNPATLARSWKLVSQRTAAIAVGYCVKWLFILAGLFLFIAPGVYLTALYFAVPTASVAEQASLRQAFRRSRALARPDLKRILFTLGLLELGGIVLSATLWALVPGGSLESPSPFDTIAGWALAIALLPLRAALMTLLYLDVRMRREGYDLQWALAHLSVNGPSDR
jgi:hypothetical protein